MTGISLWLFGGLTRFESNPETAGAELRVAAIGPLTTLACSGLFFALSQVLDGTGVSRPRRHDVRLAGVHQLAARRH